MKAICGYATFLQVVFHPYFSLLTDGLFFSTFAYAITSAFVLMCSTENLSLPNVNTGAESSNDGSTNRGKSVA